MGLSAPQVSYLMKSMKGILPEIDDRVYTVAAARDEIIKHLKKGVQQ
jgi:energy-coupling factor transport system ATP-binding protein